MPVRGVEGSRRRYINDAHTSQELKFEIGEGKEIVAELLIELHMRNQVFADYSMRAKHPH